VLHAAPAGADEAGTAACRRGGLRSRLPELVVRLPARPPPCPVSTEPARWRRRALLAALAGACLLATTPRAYDRARMRSAAERLGSQAVAALGPYLELLQSCAALDEEARLDSINAWFNRRVIFRTDDAVGGEADVWASPLELLQSGHGDCEDYVIAKYFSLLALGTPVAKLRLVYVRAQVNGNDAQAHMVLAYYAQPQAEPLILDNLVTSVRPASRRPDLTPVFSFNTEGLWQGVGGRSEGDPQARLSRWRLVLAKARNEGFL
jgi:predicted transglutaminase-like cysteine proteinase